MRKWIRRSELGTPASSVMIRLLEVFMVVHRKPDSRKSGRVGLNTTRSQSPATSNSVARYHRLGSSSPCCLCNVVSYPVVASRVDKLWICALLWVSLLTRTDGGTGLILFNHRPRQNFYVSPLGSEFLTHPNSFFLPGLRSSQGLAQKSTSFLAQASWFGWALLLGYLILINPLCFILTSQPAYISSKSNPDPENWQWYGSLQGIRIKTSHS